MKYILFILVFFSFRGISSLAEECEPTVHKPLEDKPYVPLKSDYGLELGAGLEKKSVYHLGANVGWHLGTCLWTDSQTCQQFLDILLGINGRDARTHYLGAMSLRWQYVNYPSNWGPFYRLFLGAKTSIVEDRDEYQDILLGAGVGVNRYLHPRVDVRFEARAFYADRIYSQFLFGLQFKLDEWIKFFDEKIKGI